MIAFLVTDLPVIAGALLVLLVLRQGLVLLPLRKSRRERLDRALPVLEVVGGVVFIVWAVSRLLPLDRTYGLALVGVLVLLVVGAGWFAIRDFVAGVILRSEGMYQRGHWLKADAAEGRIEQVGYRGLVVETEDGKRVKLPYSRLSTAALVTSDQRSSSKAHTFEVRVPGTLTVAEVGQRIQAAALNSFWSSVVRLPHIQHKGERDGDHLFEVTVYALDEAYGSDIERAVQRSFGFAPSATPAA